MIRVNPKSFATKRCFKIILLHKRCFFPGQTLPPAIQRGHQLWSTRRWGSHFGLTDPETLSRFYPETLSRFWSWNSFKILSWNSFNVLILNLFHDFILKLFQGSDPETLKRFYHETLSRFLSWNSFEILILKLWRDSYPETLSGFFIMKLLGFLSWNCSFFKILILKMFLFQNPETVCSSFKILETDTGRWQVKSECGLEAEFDAVVHKLFTFIFVTFYILLAVTWQLYRFPCHWLTHSLTDWLTACFEKHYQRALWETCDPWDMWPEW